MSIFSSSFMNHLKFINDNNKLMFFKLLTIIVNKYYIYLEKIITYLIPSIFILTSILLFKN